MRERSRLHPLLYPFLYAVAGFLLAAAIFASPAAYGQITTPNPPTNVQVVVGDTEAKVTWSAGADGSCATTEYHVVIYDVDPDTSVKGRVKESSTVTATEWTTDGLTPSTDYRANVQSYGISCDEYSRPAKRTFTTNANSSPSDPQRSDNEAKYAPTTPSGGRIERQGPYNLRVFWNRQPDGGEDTCAHSYYSVELFVNGEEWDEASGKTNRRHTFSDAYSASPRNSEYTAEVASYSEECDEWSHYAVVTTTIR